MENKEIIIKPVVKAKFSGLSAIPKSVTSIQGAQMGPSGTYRTGLTKDEEKEYTEKLGLKQGELNSSNEAFWGEILKLRLPNDKPFHFHINTPLDEIKYKVLISRSDIAANEIELSKKPKALFYVEDKEAKAKVEEVEMNYLYEATEIFMNMTAEERKGYIKLYNRRGADNVSDTVIKTQLFKEINKDPKRFTEYTKNPDISVRIEIEDMLENGLLKKKGNYYNYQDEVIGNSIDACVAFFKDVRNQSIKIAAIQELRIKKKGK